MPVQCDLDGWWPPACGLVSQANDGVQGSMTSFFANILQGTASWIWSFITGAFSVSDVERLAMLADPYMLAKMSEQWRLARTYGIANLLIMHKVADLNEIGDSSSGHRQKALGLLTEADTRIIYRQKHDAMRLTKEALGLSEAECEHVENLPKGVGLWKVGNRSFIVANRVTTDELEVFGTDDRMI